MTKISLLSDTHSYIDQQILDLVAESDEIWHAGDIGSFAVSEQLAAVAPLRAVYGNIDGPDFRREFPLVQDFELEGQRVWMTHIGGYPGRYAPRVKAQLAQAKPRLFISGHSHILKVMPDRSLGLLHLNPGAIGKHGFHQVRTLLRFKLSRERGPHDLEVVELKR